jgi:deoxyribodipyrimidine photo-lyase
LSTGVVWLRRDLRLFDNPAVAEAGRRHDRVLLCFCFEHGLIRGRFSSPNRNAYLIDALSSVERELREIGGRLVFREGRPLDEIPALAREIGAEAVHANADYTPHARSRDARVARELSVERTELVLHGGITCTDVGAIANTSGEPFRVFDPFFEAWRDAPRRAPELRPRILLAPDGVTAGSVPPYSRLKIDSDAKRIADLNSPGEPASRRRLDEYIKKTSSYDEARDRPDLDWTSHLSAAIHFGCISPANFEERLAARPGRGRIQLRRQLAWRDYFLHLAYHFGDQLERGHERNMREFRWQRDHKALEAWKRGHTGLPLVDAGMRQLLSEGWMHGRVRMLAAHFLTKHLLCDWREGEAHFMRHSIDGDVAINNGNWQWAASLGADPLIYFRVFNPVRQHQRFDPDGIYVRRWLPELADIPDEYIAEPWKTPPDIQKRARCVIGEDYPEPMVDLREARKHSIERFRRHLASVKS